MTRRELRACGPFWADFCHEKDMWGVECMNTPNGKHYIFYVPNDDGGEISSQLANTLNSALGFSRDMGQ